jgi:oxygen-independent coproporphyrinogen III oxidase
VTDESFKDLPGKESVMKNRIEEMEIGILNYYLGLHTAYYSTFPSPGLWEERYAARDFEVALLDTIKGTENLPLQLYVHFPYCVKQCLFCQCYQLVTQSEKKMSVMVEYLNREIDLLFSFFRRNAVEPNVIEVHLGGGSPSYLTIEMFDTLVDKIESFIDLSKVREFAIEIDPRTVDREKIRHFHKRGINRISFGIQDFDPRVQEVINRVQSVEMIEELLEERHLFKGVNFDLIYGMPEQTLISLMKTLDTVVRLSPDRIAFSILGHRPDVFKHNRKIDASAFPTLLERAMMWEKALPYFLANGYERVGMDHFAKPGDELALAQKTATVYRNLMGYSPGRFEDTLAVGPSGMTRIGNYYFGSVYEIPNYCQKIDNNLFPVFRGFYLEPDMRIRRDVMNLIMLYQKVDFNIIENKYKIDFNEYFKAELQKLQEFVALEVLELTDTCFRTSPSLGYYFLRHFCKVFDNLGVEHKHNIETGIKAKS